MNRVFWVSSLHPEWVLKGEIAAKPLTAHQISQSAGHRLLHLCGHAGRVLRLHLCAHADRVPRVELVTIAWIGVAP